MPVCSAVAWSPTDPCQSLLYYTALPLLLLTALLLLSHLPWLPSPPAILREFLPIEDVHPADLPPSPELEQGEKEHEEKRRKYPAAWRTAALIALGAAEILGWTAAGVFGLAGGVGGEGMKEAGGMLVVAGTWLYPTLHALFLPSPTPPYRLLTFYILSLLSSLLLLLTPSLPLLPKLAHALALTLLLLTLLGLPLSTHLTRTPRPYADGRRPSPEDYTTLWGWASFAWVSPLIARGRERTLRDGDVWQLSPTQQSKVLWAKFRTLSGGSLLSRLIRANAKDLFLDFVLTLLSVFLNYLAPFTLFRILSAISHRASSEERQTAYLFALLGLLATLAKAQSDLQHLWFGRRAALRAKSETVVAIYEKALKRTDRSGVTKSKEGADDDKDITKTGDKSGADTGKVVNLMAGDANRIAMTVSGLYQLYGAPFEIIIGCTFLYSLMGWSAFAGLSMMFAVLPLNHWLSKYNVAVNKKLLSVRDKRVSITNELVSAVRFIKFFAWERKWIKRALDARDVELRWMIRSRIISIVFSLVWSATPLAVTLVSFFCYTKIAKQELTVSVAFTAISLFSMIRSPLTVIPIYIVQITELIISIKRIDTFLAEPEVEDFVSALKRPADPSAVADERLGLSWATCVWHSDEEEGKEGTEAGQEERFALRDVDVVFPAGKLSVVAGPTGAGKTSLLMAILGEMKRLSGEIHLPKFPDAKEFETGLANYISYAAQQPWLEHATIKQNILFGTPYDKKRYRAVLDACALRQDLRILPDGDKTEIGERGVSLSGGQKARVALARAVYAYSKHVLLDDPLAAVDAHTARHLYEKCLKGPLLKNRTVVLITHHIDLVLPGTDYLVRILDGQIETQGFVKDLRARGELSHLVQEIETEGASGVPAEAEESAVGDAANGTADVAVPPESTRAGAVGPVEAAEAMPDEAARLSNEEDDEEEDGKPEKDGKKPRRLVEEEKRSEGNVKWSVYIKYIKAVGAGIWALLLLGMFGSRGMDVVEQFFVKHWSASYAESSVSSLSASVFNVAPRVMHFGGEAHSQVHEHPQLYFAQASSSGGKHSIDWYLGVYTLILFAGLLIGVLALVFGYWGAYVASKKLYVQLVDRVVRSPMRFFDTTPVGRILNRFTKDVETLDGSLMSSSRMALTFLIGFIVSAGIVAVLLPPFIVPAVLMTFIYYQYGNAYLKSSRDLRRIESTARSPLIAGFSELLNGLVTVRAMSAENRFLSTVYAKIDHTSAAWYSFWMCNRWLLVRFDTLGGIAVFVVSMLSLLGAIEAGSAGIAIVNAQSFVTALYWLCRAATQLEMDLNAMERVAEYLDLPQEPPAVVENSRPPAYWPSTSSTGPLIQVEDLVMKYAPDLEDVLHGVSFTVNAKEKIGLVGRTGSGKSTLAMSFFRFNDPSSGKIIVDGIDITIIGLEDLRSRITLIPQDAVLFTGTVRDNLDPFDEHDDATLLDALKRVHLISSSPSSAGPSLVASLAHIAVDVNSHLPVPNGGNASGTATPTSTGGESSRITLDTEVSSGGANFSSGQRQLIAMARALLRNSAIIIMDEATASVDFETDTKIQKTIREEFSSSCLITVAHRLRTIIDYDRILVLDAGKVVEYASPAELLSIEGGIFRGMVENSGEADELKELASAAARK